MTKQMPDDQILVEALQIAEKRLHIAAQLARLANNEAAKPPRRLSARAWLAGALRQASMTFGRQRSRPSISRACGRRKTLRAASASLALILRQPRGFVAPPRSADGSVSRARC